MQTLPTAFIDKQRSRMIEAAKSDVLKTVAYALLRQAYGVNEPPRPNVQQIVDFFDEVRRFEVSLIMQALLYSNGSKAGAARLLNLNATTLHSKIRLYSIEMPVETNNSEHQVAGPYPTFEIETSEDVATPPDLETLKTEVIKSIARVLEFKANNPSSVLDFNGLRGVCFYDEVMQFEIELLKQALAQVGGNQRAAARLLKLKTTTLNSKVKQYKLGVDFIAA